MEAGSPRLPRMAPLQLEARRRAPGELSTARNELVQPSLDRKLREVHRYVVTINPIGKMRNDQTTRGSALRSPTRLTSNPDLHNYW